MVDPPNRDELVGTPPQRLSWAEFGRAVDATAAELARRGFGKDDLLVAQLPNIWELAMLYLAAAKAGWGEALPKGEGLGIAVHRSFVSYIATVVRVKLDPDGTVRVPEAHVAIDCGFVANPERVRSKMQGA